MSTCHCFLNPHLSVAFQHKAFFSFFLSGISCFHVRANETCNCGKVSMRDHYLNCAISQSSEALKVIAVSQRRYTPRQRQLSKLLLLMRPLQSHHESVGKTTSDQHRKFSRSTKPNSVDSIPELYAAQKPQAPTLLAAGVP